MRTGAFPCQNLRMAIYPKAINDRLASLVHAGSDDYAIRAIDASFVCGSFVELSVRIDEDRGRIDRVRFRTNGCGFMTAAADVICEALEGKELSALHGLDGHELGALIETGLGKFPGDRAHCADVVFNALRKAMAIHRARRVEEFLGEKALICTCFGVSEELIEHVIDENRLTDVQQVVDRTRAGSGCGSCRFLIQELIDMRSDR